MPSELVWVAIISSGIGVGGALLGAGISGLVTHKVTKRQTDAQTVQVTKQIEHQVDEARRNRIAESRKVYLDPLKLALIQWLSASHILVSTMNSLQVGYERGVTASEYTRLSANSNNASTAASVAENELTKHLSQVADPELSALLSQAKASILPHMPGMLDSARTFASVGEQLERSENISPELLANLQGRMDQLKEIVEQRQELLIRINQRIEILAAVAD